MAQPVDIFPTVCEFLGTEKPKGLEGVSLISVINGSAVAGRSFAITSDEKMDMAVVTDGSWSLHFNPSGQRVELYDLGADPKEAENIYRDNMETAHKLHKEAIDYLRATAPESSVVNSCKALQG